MLSNNGEIVALKIIKEGETIKINLKDLKIAKEAQNGNIKPGDQGETAIINIPKWLAQKKAYPVK